MYTAEAKQPSLEHRRVGLLSAMTLTTQSRTPQFVFFQIFGTGHVTITIKENYLFNNMDI
jgi:hypothetical protein